MKTMKLWRMTWIMLAVLSLASCSSDDDDYDVNNLVGTWLQVYEEGVVTEGYVEYTFTPGVPSTSGDCDIHVHDARTDVRRHTCVADMEHQKVGQQHDVVGKRRPLRHHLQFQTCRTSEVTSKDVLTDTARFNVEALQT